jgi:hypothetical protein
MNYERSAEDGGGRVYKLLTRKNLGSAGPLDATQSDELGAYKTVAVAAG